MEGLRGGNQTKSEKMRIGHWMVLSALKGSLWSGDFVWIWWYFLRKPPLCSVCHMFRIACYLLPRPSPGAVTTIVTRGISSEHNHEFKKPRNPFQTARKGGINRFAE